MTGSGKSGFTLVELLIAMTIVGLIVGALSQVVGQVLASYHALQESQQSVPPGRFALERMVMIVQESDQILVPPTADPTEVLTASERLSDHYDNATLAYLAGGDGVPDADNNGDGLINDGTGGDPADFITFDLDKSDANNWKLMEQMPDYATASPGDFKAKSVLCEHVQAFACRRLSPGLVEIALTLRQGGRAVTLRTTARARWVD